jgi:hypothetical protein
MVATDRSATIRAITVLVVLWLPSVLVAALVTLAAILTFLSAPMWSALSFLLALPAVLVGVKSFRASAVLMVILLAWDFVSANWPHITFWGFLDSVTDVLLLVATVLSVLAAAFFPFESVIDFYGYLRFRRGY